MIARPKEALLPISHHHHNSPSPATSALPHKPHTTSASSSIRDTVQYLSCPLCFSIPTHPLVTSCCKRVVCQVCLHAWTKHEHKTTCPFCRAYIVVDKLKSDRKVVPCPYQELGCCWTGSRAHLAKHLLQCNVAGRDSDSVSIDIADDVSSLYDFSDCTVCAKLRSKAHKHPHDSQQQSLNYIDLETRIRELRAQQARIRGHRVHFDDRRFTKLEKFLGVAVLLFLLVFSLELLNHSLYP